MSGADGLSRLPAGRSARAPWRSEESAHATGSLAVAAWTLADLSSGRIAALGAGAVALVLIESFLAAMLASALPVAVPSDPQAPAPLLYELVVAEAGCSLQRVGGPAPVTSVLGVPVYQARGSGAEMYDAHLRLCGPSAPAGD